MFQLVFCNNLVLSCTVRPSFSFHCSSCGSFALCWKAFCRVLIIWTVFMRILLNIWPLNGIRASKSLPLFTIIKRRWSLLTLQIHLLFVPLCLAPSITWHAKRTPLVDKCKKEMIYCWFIYSPSISLHPHPPRLYHCTEGRFFFFNFNF